MTIFLVTSQNWGTYSGEGLLGIWRRTGPRDWRLIPVWGWGTGNLVKVSGPTRQLGFFYMELNCSKNLNCQRESLVWHFRTRSKIRVHPSEKRL